MKNRKAQVSTGFMWSIGIIFFLFLIIVTFTISKGLDLNEKEIFIDKRSECLKMSNLINSVFSAGPGAQVETNTDFLITVYDSNYISIDDIANTSIIYIAPKIAYVLSEEGPSSQDFFNEVNANYNPDPDWYKACFSGIGNADCSWSSTSWMESEIPNNISNLMDNLSRYNTIYLEDPLVHFTKDYVERLENWTAQGNALILSEHIMCEYKQNTNPETTNYQCDDGIHVDGIWDLFGVKIHQHGNAWGYSSQTNVVITDTDEAFDFSIGEELSFQERSFIENVNASNFKVIGRYIDMHQMSESRNQPAIVTWDYGQGKVFYFADFQVNFVDSSKQFTTILSDLIEIAINLIEHKGIGEDVTCTFSASAPYSQTTGDIVIRNEDNYIIITNANETS